MSAKTRIKNGADSDWIEVLKSQINPHFYLISFNSLYALTLKKSDMAPTMVIKLSEMMRYMLYECNEKECPLIKKSIIFVIISTWKTGIGNKMDIELEVHGDLENKFIALWFYKFVENAFKHGGIGAKWKGYVQG